MDGKPEGLFVRYVYPEGPAAAAGLSEGDRITSFGGGEIKDAAAFAEKLREFAPEDAVPIEVKRGSETLNLNLVLGRLPAELPPNLPLAYTIERPAAKAEIKRGLVPIKLAEFPGECIAFVPESYRAEIPHGLVVWLGPPSEWKPEELVARWKPLCEQHDLILLAPKSTDPAEVSRCLM